jgi:O-antigen/teichoic acid export membrane protein
LLKAVLTLVAGGALAQALPLLIGPWLTRLYAPEQFGVYHVFAAVAANLACVACARYEFALPLVGDAAEARALRALCVRVLVAVTGASALGAAAWLAATGAGWTAWLPLSVGVLGWLSLATLWATRAQSYRALAIARVAQYGGGSLLQAAAGLAGAGVQGLIAAPIVAAAGAAAVLRMPMRKDGSQAAAGQGPRWQDLARRFRDFPLLNTPHAFMGALQDTVSLALIAAWQGPVAAGFWGLSLRYLKAPATLVGGAVSQALYPRLAAHGEADAADATRPLRVTVEGRAAVRRVMLGLGAIAVPLVIALWALGPWAFEAAFGAQWRGAGELARALGLYIGTHFVAAPLAVVTLAWGAQAWALRLALVGQAAFVAALAIGLKTGGLQGAGWAVSAAMTLYFGYYFIALATWRVTPGSAQGKGIA